jgi:hypothetical protein
MLLKGAAYPTIANDLTPKKFYDHTFKQVSKEAADRVIEAYGVTPNMDKNKFATAAMRWCGDVIFDGMFLRSLYIVPALLS